MKTKQQKKGLERAIIGVAMLAFAAGLTMFTIERRRDPMAVLPMLPSPPRPNAYDYFASAANTCVDTNIVDYIDNRPSSSRPDLHNPAVMHAALAVLKLNRPAINQIHLGFQYAYLVPPARIDGHSPYVHFRSLGRVLACNADVAAFRGDHAELIESSLDAVQLGQMLPRGGSWEYVANGVSCESNGRSALWRNYQVLNAIECRMAIKRLNTIEKMHVPDVEVAREIKWTALSQLNVLFRWPHWKDTILSYDFDHSIRLSVGRRVEIWALSKQAVSDHSTMKLNAQIAAAALPYGSQAAPTPSDPLTDILTGDIPFFRAKDARSEAENRLLIVTLALRAYKLDHGRYPVTLQQLVPSYVPAIPIDPFTASSPVLYHVAGDQYVLYSVGPDMHDDGGRPINDKAPGSFSWNEEHATGDIVAGVNGW